MFDSDFLKRLEYLSLSSHRVFQGQLLAQRRTRRTGGGIEFAEHRDYVRGDDLRYLDWQVYARHGELLLKRFQEEEDLHVYILLDASESMNTGAPNKFLYARQLAAALAYIALADLDRVSIIPYDQHIRSALPLMRGKNNVLGLLRYLEGLETGGTKTDLAGVAREFCRRAPRTGLVLVISDLFDQDGFQAGIDRLRHLRFEPHVIQVHTTDEANPSRLGDVEFRDVETGETRTITVTEAAARQYRQRFEQFVRGVEEYCRRYGLSHTRATTDIPYDQVLLRMMRASGAVVG